jgi:hypothetical protein
VGRSAGHGGQHPLSVRRSPRRAAVAWSGSDTPRTAEQGSRDPRRPAGHGDVPAHLRPGFVALAPALAPPASAGRRWMTQSTRTKRPHVVPSWQNRVCGLVPRAFPAARPDTPARSQRFRHATAPLNNRSPRARSISSTRIRSRSRSRSRASAARSSARRRRRSSSSAARASSSEKTAGNRPSIEPTFAPSLQFDWRGLPYVCSKLT